MTSSNYYVMKAMIALAWADGKQTDEEITLLHKLIECNRFLSDAERAELKSSMHEPLDIAHVWDSIAEATQRAAVIDLALTVFNADKDYSESERKLYSTIFEKHMATLDVKSLKTDLATMAAESKARLAREEEEYVKSIQDNRQRWGAFGDIIGRVEVLLHRLNK